MRASGEPADLSHLASQRERLDLLAEVFALPADVSLAEIYR